VDDQGAWGYVKTAGYRSVDWLVDNLVDRVSKSGYLLLNVGPKADGTIPEEAKKRLLGMGEWLKVNGEAIYGTTAWVLAGEGPTRLKKSDGFNEEPTPYTPQDIRFTVKGDALYATVLDWPGEEVVIRTFRGAEDDRADVGVRRGENPRYQLYQSEIVSVSMLGDGQPLPWKLNKEGLVVRMPERKPCEHAFVVKIVRRKPY